MTQPINLAGKESEVHGLSLLLSPGFLTGLSLLLLNDFMLKPIFHNWFTGKVSDFAGLFIFPLFWISFMPRRKRPIYFATAIGFLFWKSPFARPFIDWWNHSFVLQLGREEDLTDAWALLVLPVSCVYSARVPMNRRLPRLATSIVCLLSVFAFTATSMARVEQTYNNEYPFPISQERLIDRIEALHTVMLPGEGQMTTAEVEKIKKSHRNTPVTYEIEFKDGSAERATIMVSQDQGQAKITLLKIEGRGKADPEHWREFFEKAFLGPLQDDASPTSSKIRTIWLVEKRDQ